VGGGMAGASIGYELARDRRVAVLDMEATLAYHTTGRSAAMFLESYGGPTIRALTVASRAFLEATGVLTPLPMLYVARPGYAGLAAELADAIRPLVPDVQLLDAGAATAQQPLLRPDRIERAVLDPSATEIDVAALHQHYVKGLRERGGRTLTNAKVATADHHKDIWTIRTTDERTVRACTVVNAAGAWADELAKTFGAGSVGIRPLRRTAFMVDAPPGVRPPMISDLDEAFYVKPEADRLLCSPADETPLDPCDVRPDELEIARAIDVINEVTTLQIRHVRSAWAGLRTFVADRTPVAGYDPHVPGFFWFAAQGGYGIQSAPALARTGAALVRNEPMPDDVAHLGVTAAHLAPDRDMVPVP